MEAIIQSETQLEEVEGEASFKVSEFKELGGESQDLKQELFFSFFGVPVVALEHL